MGGAWLEGSCPISLSVTQNNCWLVAESNLEKKIQSLTQKYRYPFKNRKMKSENKLLLY